MTNEETAAAVKERGGHGHRSSNKGCHDDPFANTIGGPMGEHANHALVPIVMLQLQ